MLQYSSRRWRHAALRPAIGWWTHQAVTEKDAVFAALLLQVSIGSIKQQGEPRSIQHSGNRSSSRITAAQVPMRLVSYMVMNFIESANLRLSLVSEVYVLIFVRMIHPAARSRTNVAIDSSLLATKNRLR